MKKTKFSFLLLILLIFSITFVGCQTQEVASENSSGSSSLALNSGLTGSRPSDQNESLIDTQSSVTSATQESANPSDHSKPVSSTNKPVSSTNKQENESGTGNNGTQNITSVEEDPNMSPLERMMSQKTQGSSKKKAYSDYIKTYKETTLLNFDSITSNMSVVEGATVESKYMREGKGALRWDLKKDYDSLTKMVDVRNSFDFAVKSKKTTTLKLWLFINDTDLVSCDHDSATNKIPNQATFFIRALDKNGREHCWNHTITDNGWHEIELSFNVHNGVTPNFDYQHITGFYMMFTAQEGAVVLLDHLRGVEYTTNYQPQPIVSGARVITDGEYDALDGAIIQEWYGTYYDTKDKMQGKSSLCCEGDASVNDFRLIVADTNIALDYKEDVLVLWMKLERFSSCKSLFIELNHVQDQHEYEKMFSLQELQEHGLTKENTWCRVTISLSEFTKNLKPDVYGSDENITMKNFRFVMTPNPGMSYKVNLDCAYFTTISDLLQ